jgi:hypothetical protein
MEELLEFFLEAFFSFGEKEMVENSWRGQYHK